MILSPRLRRAQTNETGAGLNPQPCLSTCQQTNHYEKRIPALSRVLALSHYDSLRAFLYPHRLDAGHCDRRVRGHGDQQPDRRTYRQRDRAHHQSTDRTRHHQDHRCKRALLSRLAPTRSLHDSRLSVRLRHTRSATTSLHHAHGRGRARAGRA